LCWARQEPQQAANFRTTRATEALQSRELMSDVKLSCGCLYSSKKHTIFPLHFPHLEAEKMTSVSIKLWND
jgi:hypothetical protein